MIQSLQYLRLTIRRVPALAWTVGLSLFLLSARAGLSQTAPQLAAVALTSASPLSAGSNLSYAFWVEEGTYPIISVSLDVDDKNGYDYLIAGNLFAGTITFPTTTYWVNGSYTVQGININDGHSDTNYPLGGTVTNSSGEAVVATNPVTSSLNFTLSGGEASITGSTVTAFTPLRSNPFRAIGSTLVFNLGLNLGTRNEVTELDLLVQDPNMGEENIQAVGNLTGSQAVFPLSGLTITGAYTVLGLGINDGYGNEVFSSEFPPSVIFETPGTATIDYSSLGFMLTPAPGDINHDGKPDIFWTNMSSGERGAYLMNGTTTEGWADLGTVPLAWRIGAVADFKGNGQNDILWQNTSTGECGFYLMNGTTVTGWAELGTVPTAWRAAAAADFEGNGNNDILWQNTSTGECGFYLMNGTTVTGWAELGIVDPSWRIAGAADFNGDGNPDILWQNTVTGQCGIYVMNGTSVTGWVDLGTLPALWRAVAVGYFSGDGSTDILWQNAFTGECGFYTMNGTTVTGWVELGTVPTQWQIQE